MPGAETSDANADYNEYLEFFDIMGITDATKVPFLSSLLRQFHEAATRLDAHLAPHGACLHSAVSRMYSSGRAHDPSRHRWIRVVDRLGFFTDKDVHAQIIVNVGLSFAYRRLEVNRLTEDNAVLLSNVGDARRPPSGGTAGDPGGVPPGGMVISQRHMASSGIPQGRT
eukprot:TRINITY_DN6049_c0_g1_i2.p2 TRINITY_DN6049_c0_g1~~TRINITY_DN6049_c0_g1_i2.p2  ORF type:complete len:169 (+),score=17.36 TRINITY_DN6049_c0_g1_i2:245-751(+)